MYLELKRKLGREINQARLARETGLKVCLRDYLERNAGRGKHSYEDLEAYRKLAKQFLLILEREKHLVEELKEPISQLRTFLQLMGSGRLLPPDETSSRSDASQPVDQSQNDSRDFFELPDEHDKYLKVRNELHMANLDCWYLRLSLALQPEESRAEAIANLGGSRDYSNVMFQISDSCARMTKKAAKRGGRIFCVAPWEELFGLPDKFFWEHENWDGLVLMPPANSLANQYLLDLLGRELTVLVVGKKILRFRNPWCITIQNDDAPEKMRRIIEPRAGNVIRYDKSTIKDLRNEIEIRMNYKEVTGSPFRN
jgi:hypothetical protein